MAVRLAEFGTLIVATMSQLDYTSVTIGPIGTGRSVVGHDLNNVGIAVGVATSNLVVSPEFQPWIWDAQGGVRSLVQGQGPSEFVWAGPINDNGAVAGGYYAPFNGAMAGLPVPFGWSSHALFWATDGSGDFTEIPGLGQILGLAELGNNVGGINNRGAIVGVSVEQGDSPFGDPRAYLFDEDGVLHDLSTLGGPRTTVTIAKDINDGDEICGEMIVDAETRAFFHSLRTGLVVIPRLAETQTFMTASAINKRGQVVGWASADDPTLPDRGYVWHADDGLLDMGPFLPLDINNNGDIVAIGPAPPDEGNHAYVRIEGEWTDLNDVIRTTSISWLSRPVAINDQRQILVVERFNPFQTVFVHHLTHVLTPFESPSDLNGDGSVDIADLLALLAAWGPCPDPPEDCVGDLEPCVSCASPSACPADLDGDCNVGIADFLILLANWSS